MRRSCRRSYQHIGVQTVTAHSMHHNPRIVQLHHTHHSAICGVSILTRHAPRQPTTLTLHFHLPCSQSQTACPPTLPTQKPEKRRLESSPVGTHCCCLGPYVGRIATLG
ncbi:hypothetical protein E2C01_009410 [Portunus trituberculatus]|uniref:Uncharacterized protein n=1 Tax=Portunus trituberculatus TaxID=210409 RepID=A0A5B7D4Y2_PORTR|nr:hypothetical protein [Portunus trituberculatus]